MLIYLNQLTASDFSHLEMLKKNGTVSHHPKKTIIFQQNDFGSLAYAPINGIIKVVLLSSSGQTRTISYITPGIFFGQSAAFTGVAVTDTLAVVSVTDVDILAVPKETILDFMFRFPDLAAYMLKCAGLMISNLQDQIVATSFGDAYFQVASLLNSFPKQQKEGKECVIISQEELASIIGKTRVTVANTLKRLQDMKIIRLVGNKTIVIENKEELAYLVSEMKGSN